MREELELGALPLDIQLEDVGQWVRWGLGPEPALEGPPLLPLGADRIDVDGTKQAQAEGNTAEDNAMVEQANSSPS